MSLRISTIGGVRRVDEADERLARHALREEGCGGAGEAGERFRGRDGKVLEADMGEEVGGEPAGERIAVRGGKAFLCRGDQPATLAIRRTCHDVSPDRSFRQPTRAS